MIEFNARGYITPPEAIDVDFDTFEQTFVFNDHRKLIFDEYQTFLTTLKDLGIGPFSQWLNGSFTTKKQYPNDIDVVTFVNFAHYERLDRVLREIKLDFRSRKKIDCYFIVTYPENHPNYLNYQADKLQFLHDFTHDVKREKILNTKLPKGLIQINFNNEQ
jgi:hypothetical protein